MPTWTDNRGNGAALNKLMATRHPTNALIMNMSAYFKHLRIKALIEWIPRVGNKEADSLANGVDPALEVKIDDAVLTWLVDVLAMGKAGQMPGFLRYGFGAVGATVVPPATFRAFPSCRAAASIGRIPASHQGAADQLLHPDLPGFSSDPTLEGG